MAMREKDLVLTISITAVRVPAALPPTTATTTPTPAEDRCHFFFFLFFSINFFPVLLSINFFLFFYPIDIFLSLCSIEGPPAIAPSSAKTTPTQGKDRCFFLLALDTH